MIIQNINTGRNKYVSNIRFTVLASLVINVVLGAGDIMVNTSIAGFIFAFKLIGGVFPTISYLSKLNEEI